MITEPQANSIRVSLAWLFRLLQDKAKMVDGIQQMAKLNLQMYDVQEQICWLYVPEGVLDADKLRETLAEIKGKQAELKEFIAAWDRL